MRRDLIRNGPPYHNKKYDESYSMSVYDFVETCKNRDSKKFEFNASDKRGPPSGYKVGMFCYLNNRLYMAGEGKRTFAYDLTSSQWLRLYDMNVARSKFYFGEMNGHLYAVAVMCNHFLCCSCNGMINVSGGCNIPNGYEAEKRMWQYDPASNRWAEKPLMLSSRRFGHDMVSFRDVPFVFGDLDSKKNSMSLEMYDCATGQWSYVIKMKKPVKESLNFIIKNCLFIFNKRSNLFQKINLSKCLNNRKSSSPNASHALPANDDDWADDDVANNEPRKLMSGGIDNDDEGGNVDGENDDTDNNFNDNDVFGTTDDDDVCEVCTYTTGYNVLKEPYWLGIVNIPADA
ncbi:hypothetical protein HELRODRAFT_180048 [Helobdella robusta]|uniref:Uncharacterized protein n=1 Tax=Helobdella robusta TaxID=6412 RepID=T1FFE3_HELRO|nr:hypothetical protein HELRODRAFT_180048 [Helobdella robusta]ESN94941.1 hypothetical protein HELRODRAFT_180048 [Helobdella robusta]